MLKLQTTMNCLYCGREYPARKSKKFCSGTCRVRCFEKFNEMDRVLSIFLSDEIYKRWYSKEKLLWRRPKTMTEEQARYEDYKFRVANEIRNAYKNNYGQEWFMDRVYPVLTEELCHFHIAELDTIVKRAVANVRERIKAQRQKQGER